VNKSNDHPDLFTEHLQLGNQQVLHATAPLPLYWSTGAIINQRLPYSPHVQLPVAFERLDVVQSFVESLPRQVRVWQKKKSKTV